MLQAEWKMLIEVKKADNCEYVKKCYIIVKTNNMSEPKTKHWRCYEKNRVRSKQYHKDNKERS